ncbi:hypothetical protein EII17_03165 [Clostridiales bacterium COT073_COT-073]|nr:hypothetical protein EII17_03165 [Clostridiales bacterium COT073_COT-073]
MKQLWKSRVLAFFMCMMLIGGLMQPVHAALTEKDLDITWLDPAIKEISFFKNGVAVIEGEKENGQYYEPQGLISTGGAILIPMEYYRVYHYTHDSVITTINPDIQNDYRSYYALYNFNGQMLSSFSADALSPEPFQDDLAYVFWGVAPGHYSYLDQTGRVVYNNDNAEGTYEEGSNFRNGVALAKKFKKIGEEHSEVVIINKEMQEIKTVKNKYDSLDSDGFSADGYARILHLAYENPMGFDKYKLGLIDDNGNEILSCIYDKIWMFYDENKFFYEDLVRVEKDGRKYLVDKQGNEFHGTKNYDDCGHFTEGLCGVGKNGRYGFIDKNGQEVIACQYKGVYEFREGLAGFQADNGKFGFLDKTGKIVIEPIFDNVKHFHQGVAAVKKGERWGLLKKSSIENSNNNNNNNTGNNPETGNSNTPYVPNETTSPSSSANPTTARTIPSKPEEKTLSQDKIANAIHTKTGLDLEVDKVQLHLDWQLLKELENQKKGDLKISVQTNKQLSQEQKALIGQKPVIDLRITTANGKEINSFGDQGLLIQIPYTLENTEKPENMIVYSFDSKQAPKKIPNSLYDLKNKKMVFQVKNPAPFAIGYQREELLNFTDTNQHWAKNEIAYVSARNLLIGTEPQIFSPDVMTTKAMLITVLGRLAEVEENKYPKAAFDDLAENAYYSNYVNWAMAKGIIQGNQEGKFAPDASVSREEMAVILKNYLQISGIEKTMESQQRSFSDQAQISEWAKEAVAMLSQMNIMIGKDDNQFDPQGTVTRAEIATILTRLIKLQLTK